MTTFVEFRSTHSRNKISIHFHHVINNTKDKFVHSGCKYLSTKTDYFQQTRRRQIEYYSLVTISLTSRLLFERVDCELTFMPEENGFSAVRVISGNEVRRHFTVGYVARENRYLYVDTLGENSKEKSDVNDESWNVTLEEMMTTHRMYTYEHTLKYISETYSDKFVAEDLKFVTTYLEEKFATNETISGDELLKVFISQILKDMIPRKSSDEVVMCNPLLWNKLVKSSSNIMLFRNSQEVIDKLYHCIEKDMGITWPERDDDCIEYLLKLWQNGLVSLPLSVNKYTMKTVGPILTTKRDLNVRYTLLPSDGHRDASINCVTNISGIRNEDIQREVFEAVNVSLQGKSSVSLIRLLQGEPHSGQSYSISKKDFVNSNKNLVDTLTMDVLLHMLSKDVVHVGKPTPAPTNVVEDQFIERFIEEGTSQYPLGYMYESAWTSIEQIWQTNVDDGVCGNRVLIESSLGSGKTSLLHSLSRSSPSHFWVVMLDASVMRNSDVDLRNYVFKSGEGAMSSVEECIFETCKSRGEVLILADDLNFRLLGDIVRNELPTVATSVGSTSDVPLENYKKVVMRSSDTKPYPENLFINGILLSDQTVRGLSSVSLTGPIEEFVRCKILKYFNDCLVVNNECVDYALMKLLKNLEAIALYQTNMITSQPKLNEWNYESLNDLFTTSPSGRLIFRNLTVVCYFIASRMSRFEQDVKFRDVNILLPTIIPMMNEMLSNALPLLFEDNVADIKGVQKSLQDLIKGGNSIRRVLYFVMAGFSNDQEKNLKCLKLLDLLLDYTNEIGLKMVAKDFAFLDVWLNHLPSPISRENLFLMAFRYGYVTIHEHMEQILPPKLKVIEFLKWTKREYDEALRVAEENGHQKVTTYLKNNRLQ